jgi:hypothetical protein
MGNLLDWVRRGAKLGVGINWWAKTRMLLTSEEPIVRTLSRELTGFAIAGCLRYVLLSGVRVQNSKLVNKLRILY